MKEQEKGRGGKQGAVTVCAVAGHITPQKQERLVKPQKMITIMSIIFQYNHAVTTNMPENDLGMSWMFLPTVHGCSLSILFLLESTKNSTFIKPCHGKGDTHLHPSNMI
jgi:hypothetical protein